MGAAVLTTLILVFAQSVPLADAAVFRGGETYDLSEDSTLEGDLYVLGERLTFSGTTTGDIIAIGSQILLEGAVGGDVLLFGGRMTVMGSVAGDLRVIGAELLVNGQVGEDMVAGAANVTLGPDAKIEGDLFVFGDRLVLNGEVQGAVRAEVRSTELLGDVGADVELRLRESLAVKGDAELLGNLSYRAPREAFISDTVVIEGGVEYEPVEQSGGDMGFDPVALMLNILVLVVAAATLVTFFPTLTRRAAEAAFDGGGILALKGLGLLIAWPVASILLMVTIIGFIPAMVLIMLYFVTIFVAMALSPVLAGAALARWLKKDDADGFEWSWAALGAIALVLITFLPFIGWLVRVLMFLLAFGTISVLFGCYVWTQRKAAPVINDTKEEVDEVVQEESDQEHASNHEEDSTTKETKDSQEKESAS